MKYLVLIFFNLHFCLAVEKIDVVFMDGFSRAQSYTANELEQGLNVFLTNYPDFKKKFNIVKMDHGGDVEKTVNNFKKLNSSQKIVIGVTQSNHAMAIKELAMQKKITVISPAATHDNLDKDTPFVYRVCFNNTVQAEFLSKILKKKKERILILKNITSIYSSDLSNKLYEMLDKDMVKMFSYIGEKLKINNLIDLIKTYNPKYIFLPDHEIVSAKIVNRLFKQNPNIIFIGGDGWQSKAFEISKEKVNDQKIYYLTHWSKETNYEENKKFIKTFKKIYPNIEPLTNSALMYDVLLMLSSASSNIKDISNFSQNFYENTRKVKVYGATGIIEYMKENTPKKEVVLIKIVNEKLIKVRDIQ